MREVVRNRTTDIDPASSDYVHALEVRNPNATRPVFRAGLDVVWSLPGVSPAPYRTEFRMAWIKAIRAGGSGGSP